VDFAYDTEQALRSAVVLVNSAEPPDTLTTVDQLDDFYTSFGFTGRRDRTQAELDSVRAARPLLRRLLTAQRDEAVSLVNEMLAQARAVPRLVRHDEYDWHVHATDDERPLVTRITVETAMAMVDVIRADEMSRLSICADVTCNGVVLDLSRNRSKRFCSVTCGNRNAVAAYRQRRRAD
jgi:predicted RNA-binding Zn ribbon-like protein